jgi:hypothetical protein
MSNHTNDPWETEMSRTFDRRVRDLHEAPLNLDQVKGKAVRIRRNRRIAVAGGVLAAAAVIVPVAVFAGNGLTENDSGPGFAGTPSPKETATDPAGLGFGYIEGRRVHLPDGTKMVFPDSYRGGVVLGEKFFGLRSDDDTGQLYLDVSGGDVFPTETTEILSGPVVNDEHTMLAYIEMDGDLVTRSADAQTTVATGLSPNSALTAVTGGPDCRVDACRLYVDDDVVGEPQVFDENGDATATVPSGAVGVQDADESGLLTVQTSYSDQGSCGGVYDLAKSDYVWQTCDFFLYDLAPGSKYVDATHPYLDGFGNAYASILDAATGREIIQFDPPDGTIVGTTWQDEKHLLARVYDSEGWSVYRIGADKTVEQVLEPKGQGNDADPAYTVLD